MNPKNKLLENLQSIFFYLFIFLIPSQLGYHLWPSFSYVFGLKIDYLSPTIFLTDCLIFIYLLFFLINNKFKLINKSRILKCLVFLSFISINIAFSNIKELAFIKWLKIIELSLLSLAISKDFLIDKKKVLNILSFSILFFGVIGFLQFIKGSTLGGAFYFLGERNFNTATPGISLLNIFNYSFLKPYSTFSHPNSFAGYLVVVSIFLFYWKVIDKKEKILKFLALTVSLCLIILCFSQSVYIALVVLFFFFVFLTKNKYIKKQYACSFLIAVILSSLFMPVYSSQISKTNYFFSSSVKERLTLSQISGEMFLNSPLTGIGLNNFINNIPTTYVLRVPFWFLQPVHNIFLLFTVETGIIGICLLFVYLYKYISYLIKNRKTEYLLILIAIITTGFFDHYWLTLQQNIVLFFLMLGLSKNKKIG